MKRLLPLLLLSGCTWIGNTADNLGSHMPVIGERCEHWQCMTSSGKSASEANKRAKLNPPPAAAPATASAPAPAPASIPPATPAEDEAL